MESRNNLFDLLRLHLIVQIQRVDSYSLKKKKKKKKKTGVLTAAISAFFYLSLVIHPLLFLERRNSGDYLKEIELSLD